MTATYSLNMMSEDELRTVIADSQRSLDELAPYNGTAPGADAISKARHRRDAAQAELDSRGA